MLQHEILVVFNWKFVLLLHQVVVLPQLELKLVYEHFDLLLWYLDSLLCLVTFFQQFLQKLLWLEFYAGGDFEKGHAGFGGAFVGSKCDYIFEWYSIGVHIKICLVPEAGDMNDGAEVKMGV